MCVHDYVLLVLVCFPACPKHVCLYISANPVHAHYEQHFLCMYKYLCVYPYLCMYLTRLRIFAKPVHVNALLYWMHAHVFASQSEHALKQANVAFTLCRAVAYFWSFWEPCALSCCPSSWTTRCQLVLIQRLTFICVRVCA